METRFFPSRYEPKWSYCQPQREDWPVYDADAGVYVEWSTATSHLESMLELDEQSCLQLRCIELFHRYARERGKSQKAPVYNKAIRHPRPMGGADRGGPVQHPAGQGSLEVAIRKQHDLSWLL